MRKFFGYVLMGMFVCSRGLGQGEMQNFDNDWRFHAGGLLGGETVDLDDGGWRKVDLPHDWSIEDIPDTRSPFDPAAVNQVGGGFTRQGTAWYRKTFTLPATDSGHRVIIQFDGVYMNADVYVNGRHVGNHPYGYTSFYYDITPELKFGEKNTLAVEVKNEGANSRWYSGSGIYRHVWLKTVASVHIAQWGSYITTPEVSSESATVQITTRVVNENKEGTVVHVVTRLLNSTGIAVGRSEKDVSLAAGATTECHQQIVVGSPQLWSCESPALYKTVTEVYREGRLVSSEPVSFGIRSISFDATNGFRLNGRMVKLKGGCFHIDNGPLGSCAYDRAEERKVELLKASGFNAIRCSHNPPSPAFLDACDRAGMLVIDESYDMWNFGKNPYDYHLYFKDWWQRDMESMILRDRNHPSIIMWSIGNEIPESGSLSGVETAHKLAAYVRELDPGRSITAAVNSVGADKDGFFSALDVAGYNYAVGGYPDGLYERDHQRMPARVMVGTESYPLDAFGAWMDVEDHPFVIGDFVWTAWDYIGEASIGWLGYPQRSNFYPWNLAFCGDIDVCGWKRPQSYYRNVLWRRDQLSVFVRPPQPSFKENPDKADWSKWNWVDAVAEWNWKGYEGKPLEVNVYSSCEKVELFLNGRSLGVKTTDRSSRFIATFSVSYQPGELKAVGYRGGVVMQQAMLTTAGVPEKIRLTADRSQLKADGQDLSYITVELTDKKGNINPASENLLHFDITGDAKVVGVGNGNPMSLESFQQPHRKAWKGKCLVIVKAGRKPGQSVLKVSGEGLPATQIALEIR